MRRNDPARAQDRLHDKGRNGARPLEGDLILQCLQAQLREFGRIGFVEGVAIDVGCWDVVAAGQKGLISGAEIGVAVDRGATEMRAVIALFQRQKLDPPRLALDLVILPRQAQGGLDRVRSARGVEGPRQAVGFKEGPQLLGQLNHLVIRGATEDRVIGQSIELRRDGVFDRLAGIAKVDVPEPADGIHHLMPVDVLDPHTAGTGDDRRRVLQAVCRCRHRVPQAARIVGLEEVLVFHVLSFQSLARLRRQAARAWQYRRAGCRPTGW